ncbi:MAG: RHS repeat-associated core domain-containing protein, partial [Flavobacteriales bacterium]|nr:RHS repeat-associated core domain-containing protein [Flavobacteriales bacterium]
AFIIPPKTFAHMEATGNYNCYHPDNKEGIYRYSFNDKGLLIRKYIPGAGLSKIYYNAIGQVIMTEDPKGQKTFSKYDSFGREIINGIYFGTALPSSNDGLFEIKSNNSEGYTTDLSFPQSQIEIHNISYYDDYDFNGDLNVQSIEEYTNPQDGIFASEADSRTIGMLTGNRTGLFNKKGDVVIDYQISSMFYDSLGNMIQAKLENQTHEIDINNMLYNYSGDVVKTKKMHRSNIEGNLVSKSILKEYVFDHRSRLIEEYISVDGMAPVKTVHNSYDKLNRLSSKRLGLGNNLDEYLQKLDFKYNIRGQLKSINNLGDCESVVIIDPTGGTVEGRFTDQNGEVGIKNVQNNLIFNDDLFSLQLSYHTNSKLNIQPKFDGTIAAVEWQEGCDQLIEAYAFDYDNRDQLIEGDYSIRNTDESYLSVPNYDVNNVQYDLNGNILQLERNGSQGNTIDLLDYQIGLDNRLQSIEETGDQNEGFISQNSFGQYHYDQNGNMNRDDHKAFTIIYNSLDLPAIIAFDSGDSIVNIYNTLGQKLEKWTKPAGASLNDWSKKYYFSEIEYLDGNIESIAFDDGRITPSAGSFQFEYSIKDHLGNSRVNFADLNHDNEITEDEVLQRNAYYPFGMEMSKPNQAIIGTENDYQYNGKEITQDFGLNWYDYQARWYDPAIARWHTIDPLAESFQNWSPYNYVLNKPVNLIDPDGMAPDQPDPNDPPLESASLVWLRSESLRKDYESSLGKGVVMEVVGKSTKKDRSQKTKETWEAGNDYTMDEGFVRFSNKDINKNATNTIVLGANVSVSSDNPSNANGSAGFSWDYGENPQFTAGNSIGLVDKKIGPAKGALSISNSATVDLLTGESSSSTTINGTIGLQYGKEGGPSIGVMTTKLSKNVKTGKFTPSTSIVSISTKAFGRQWSGAITAKLKTARKVIYTIEK